MSDFSRRQVLAAGAAVAAAGATGGIGPAFANASKADVTTMFQTLANAPWAASPGGNPAKPIYVFWAPWCPICHKLMVDQVKSPSKNYELRWIGNGGRTDEDRALIAAAAKARDFKTVKSILMREPVSTAGITEDLVKRVHAVDLITFVIQQAGAKIPGFPTFITFNGDNILYLGGYSSPASLDRLAAASDYGVKPAASATRYLTDAWTDLGPASGQPHSPNKAYTMYSHPSETSIPVRTVPKGMMWPEPEKRYIGVNGQKWVSVDGGVSLGDTSFDCYIKVG